MNSLPNELTHYILLFINDPFVCRFVCRLWRDLFPVEQSVRNRTRYMSWLVANGYLELMKWARANGCPWEKYTCTAAARRGNLEMLKWLRDSSIHGNKVAPWNEGTCDRAAQNGHLEVLKWLRSEDCPWGKGTCGGAAFGGHLEILKWARGYREDQTKSLDICPWNLTVCCYAAEHGYVEILKWAIENDAYWNKRECLRLAKRGGHSEIYKMIAEKKICEELILNAFSKVDFFIIKREQKEVKKRSEKKK